MMDRLSTGQILNMLTSQISSQQQKVLKSGTQISSGKKFQNAYDDPLAASQAMISKGDGIANKRRIENIGTSKLELDSAESALTSMEDLTRKIRELVVQGSSGQYGADEREAIALEVRQYGELLISMANTRAADKYIFSGAQSNLPTFKMNDGAAFTSAVFKGGSDNGTERKIDGIQTSVSINSLFNASTSAASISGTKLNPTLSDDYDLVLAVDKGDGTEINFTASLSSGDDLSDVISTVNFAFVAAGGAGQIASESPSGHLNLGTGSIIGDTPGEESYVTISSSSDDDALNELGLRAGVYRGTEAGLLNTLNTIENALNTNNPSSLQSSLARIDYNLEKLNNVRAQVGALTNRLDSLENFEIELEAKLTKDLSIIQDTNILTASQEYSNAQASLQAAIQTSSNFIQSSYLNLSTFLGGSF